MLPNLKILFLCTGNTCRSQMAEGWARHLHADSLDAYSAGVAPGHLDSRAVAVMAEVGVDISAQCPKSVSEMLEVPLDLVVTVCDQAQETCPVFPGRVRMMHRSLADPPRLAAMARTEEEALGHYRQVRDEIRTFVADLPRNLNVEVDLGSTVEEEIAP